MGVAFTLGGNKMKNCRKCENPAKYEADTVFGKWYLCGIHIKNYRNNLSCRNIKLVNKLK